MMSQASASSGTIGPAAAFVRLAITSVLALTVTVVLGYGPTVNLGGTSAIPGMLIGAAVALATGLAGAVPAVLALARDEQARLLGTLLGTAVRFGATLVALLVVILSDIPQRKTILAWIAIGYAVLLITDTLTMHWLLTRRTKVTA